MNTDLRIGLALVLTTVFAVACGGDTVGVGEGGGTPRDLECSIPSSQIFNGGPGKDGIPALTDPPLVAAADSGADYLRDDDRVIGVIVGEEALAVPLNIMWWHEIVNLSIGDHRLAITHCPLTGSSLAFDREPLGGVELGVSGLLYRNNLIMYDRSGDESLWPQLVRGARCGARDGTDLVMYPTVEMTWQGWRVLHPGTRVVSSETGWPRDYQTYPYGDYDRIDNRALLFPFGTIDPRRPAKERVLGIPVEDGGVAFPYGEFESLGQVAVVDQGDYVVFWAPNMEGAMAFLPRASGRNLTFGVDTGRIVDRETGSTWQIDGVATAGPMAGARLEAVSEAYVVFWFAWAAFQPNTTVWTAS